MLWQRITFGSLMIAALASLIWLDAHWTGQAALPDSPDAYAQIEWAARHGLIVAGLWALIVVFATRELGGLLRWAGYAPATGWAAMCNVVLALLPWGLWNAAAMGTESHSSASPVDAAVHTMLDAEAVLMLLLVALIGAFAAIAARKTTERGAQNIAMTMFLVLYLGVFGSFIARLRMAAGTPWALLYVLLVIKSCDIGAYFTGLAAGRTKLIAWLSPKKTWEGLLGGVLLSMATAVGLAEAGVRVSQGAGYRVAGGAGLWPAWPRALAMGAVLAVLGQAADLLESLIKRSVGAKDSGRVLPAFGGLLDILDSPLICVPAAYWMMLK